MPAPHPDEYRMSLGDHLEELRSRLIKGFVGPFIFGAILLFFGEDVVEILVRPLRLSLRAKGLPEIIYTTTAGETFNTYIKLAMIGGLIIGIPWLMWQLWKFIEPGLHFHERKIVQRLIPGSAFLTVVGVLFMYFVLLPLTLYFLIDFSLGFNPGPVVPTRLEQAIFGMSASAPPVDPGATPTAMGALQVLTVDPEKPVEGQLWVNMPLNEVRIFAGGVVHRVALSVPSMMQPIFTLGEYVTMVLWMAAAFAISFQLPLVMLVVGWTNLMPYEVFAKGRKYAFLVCVIVAAILTPSSDPFSLAVMTAPLYGLYELGLILMRVFKGKRSTGGEPDGDADGDAGGDAVKD